MVQLERLRAFMQTQGIPAICVSDMNMVGWLTGFTGTYARVLVTPDDTRFITDSRYTIQAAEEVPSMPVVSFASLVDGDQFLAEQAREMQISRLGLEGSSITYAQWQKLVEKLAGIELIPVNDLSHLRMVKTPGELANMRRACGVADSAFGHILRMIQPGVTEIDICLDLEFFMRRQGADVAFPSIVVSGERSARPHGKPSEKALEVGDFVTMDFGACVDGYNSDITRTVVVGDATERHREVYGAVLEAQLAAIDALRAGRSAKEIDALAREVLGRFDLARYFGHGLGHGLGRVVHDAGRMNATSTDIIAPGQVWTVEPGVYIPDFGGVRIEDDVLITEDGIEILTSATKELLVLPSK
jgi:Xaa-Pro aminopeptidase